MTIWDKSGCIVTLSMNNTSDLEMRIDSYPTITIVPASLS